MASYIGQQPARQSIVLDDAITSAKIFDGTVAGADLASDITISTTGTITTSQVNLGDNERIRIGNSQDLQLYNNGTSSFIKEFTGNLRVLSSNLLLQNTGGTDTFLEANVSGSVDLYYNNSKKIETTSTGATVTGTLVADGISLGDSEKAEFGASNDLAIYHDGSQSIIEDVGTGQLKILAENTWFAGSATSSHFYFRAVKFGGFEAYHNNSKKFETTSAGATVTGNFNVEGTPSAIGNDTIQVDFSAPEGRIQSKNSTASPASNLGFYTTDTGGTTNKIMHLTYDGKVGIGTASPSSDLHIRSASAPKIKFDEGGLEMGLTYTSGDLSFNPTSSGNRSITFENTGTGGMTVNVDGDLAISTGSLSLGDASSPGTDNTLNLGASSDLRIYHTGSDSVIEDIGSGDLYVKASNNVYFQGYNSNHVIARYGDFGGNGFAELYYGNSKKIETTSAGATITGTVVSDGLTINTSGSSSNNDTAIALDINGTNHVRQRITTSTTGGYQASLALESDSNEVTISTAGSNEIRFTTNSNERMRIDSAGRVAIGTTPNTATTTGGLHVHGSGNPIIRITNATTGSGTTDGLIIGNSGGDTLDFQVTNYESGFLGFGTSGSEAMRINSSGYVGIGTSSPTQFLSVEGSIANDWVAEFKQQYTTASGSYGVQILGGTNASDIAFNVRNAAASNELFRIRGDGNVGIGTSSPGAKLHVRYDHQQTDVTTASSYRVLNLHNAGTGDGVYNAIKFAANQQDMYIMSINHSSQSSRRFGFFVGSVAGDATSDERLSIKGDGKVGINTTSPLGELHVKDGGSSTDAEIYVESDSSDRARLRLWSGSVAKFEFSVGGTADFGTTTGHDVKFNTNNSERMRITSGGNIGINTTSPGANLDVNGTLLANKAYIAETTLTDGATISWDMATQSVAKVTLGGNRTLSAPSNGTTGQFASLLVIQDGTGSRTLTWNAAYEFKDDTAPTLTTTASKGDLFTFRYNGSKWLEVGRNLNLTLS